MKTGWTVPHPAQHHDVSILRLGLRSDRVAVSAFFFVNGLMVGTWAAKIPAFVARLGITESTMGLLVLTFGVGSLVIMPIFGGLTARFGSGPVAKRAALLAVPMLVLITLAPNTWVAGLFLFFFGGFLGGMDVAMNANAVAVEKRMRRAIMSSCHGFWSLGGLIGAGIGGVLISRLGLHWHAGLITLFLAAIVLAVMGWLLAERPQTPREKSARLRLPAAPLPYLIGIMALFSMIPEGAVLDWGGLYLREELGADLALAGWAFAAFSATMALMRFVGDRLRQALGAVTTLRVCALFALTGMVLAGQATSPFMAILGYAIAGIGMSNLVPICFSAAGNIAGLAPGIGLSVVTVMGYSGVLLAPGLIGLIAEHTGFARIFTGLALLLVVTLVCAPLARGANFSPE